MKYVFCFGNGTADGAKEMKAQLGGKGANLAEMARIGLPVPPGFTISTDAWQEWRKASMLPNAIRAEIERAVSWLGTVRQRHFGSRTQPLLVSVRSGAPVSMPGMMETILNLGLNDEATEGLAVESGNARFAYDCYRRLIAMLGNVAFGIEEKAFEDIFSAVKRKHRAGSDTELDERALAEVIIRFQETFREQSGCAFPQDPWEQLWQAVAAVFRSWDNPHAAAYRQKHGIPSDLGTAVNVQSMVFGNLSDNSGTAVAFTRNPTTGDPKIYGEYLPNAQGEDVVAGIRTPRPLSELRGENPEVWNEIETAARLLEQHFGWPQDIEITYERGTLFLLQTRDAKCEAQAQVRIARDFVREGYLSEGQALSKIDASAVVHLFHAQIAPGVLQDPVAFGLPASSGAAYGEAIFSSEEAVKAKQANAAKSVLLVRDETTPRDFPGMNAANGFLTARGGYTSHAAIVARGLGKPAVVGCTQLAISERGISLAGRKLRKDTTLTIDGTHGTVFWGKVPLSRPMEKPQDSSEFMEVLSWADRQRRLKVLANADTPKDARVARDMGAEGIGLCRTEHMFQSEDRLPFMQQMICAAHPDARRQALSHLLPFQREDFTELFRVMHGLPVTIRLLDPPLREFLPEREALARELRKLRRKAGSSEERKRVEQLISRVDELSEVNPMLGLRGVRLLLAYPEIGEMQVRAICEAACLVAQEGHEVIPEIMVPLVVEAAELRMMRQLIEDIAQSVFREQGTFVAYRIGTMIEVAGACDVADELAREAEFFSFGTNDLTQTVLGFSRDDTVLLVQQYLEKGIFAADPWASLDEKRVRRSMERACVLGRSVRNDLKIGICGDHGGDPASIRTCEELSLDYVSASPYRIPGARIAAAQARKNQKTSS